MRLLDMVTKNLAHSANATKLAVKRYPPHYRFYVAPLREKKSLPDSTLVRQGNKKEVSRNDATLRAKHCGLKTICRNS